LLSSKESIADSVNKSCGFGLLSFLSVRFMDFDLGEGFLREIFSLPVRFYGGSSRYLRDPSFLFIFLVLSRSSLPAAVRRLTDTVVPFTDPGYFCFFAATCAGGSNLSLSPEAF